jgi:hypothetical protein
MCAASRPIIISEGRITRCYTRGVGALSRVLGSWVDDPYHGLSLQTGVIGRRKNDNGSNHNYNHKDSPNIPRIAVMPVITAMGMNIADAVARGRMAPCWTMPYV